MTRPTGPHRCWPRLLFSLTLLVVIFIPICFLLLPPTCTYPCSSSAILYTSGRQNSPSSSSWNFSFSFTVSIMASRTRRATLNDLPTFRVPPPTLPICRICDLWWIFFFSSLILCVDFQTGAVHGLVIWRKADLFRLFSLAELNWMPQLRLLGDFGESS